MRVIGSSWIRTAAVMLGLAVTATAVQATTASATARVATPTTLSRFDQRLLTDINAARTAHGMRPLVLVAGTTDIAHQWSCHLGAAKLLGHNPSLAAQLATHGSNLWTAYAENVGYVPARAGAGTMFRAYLRSPVHRANILDPAMRYVGVWSKRSGGHRFNTIDFVGADSRSYTASYGAARVNC